MSHPLSFSIALAATAILPLAGVEPFIAPPGWTQVAATDCEELALGVPPPDGEYAVYDGFLTTYHKKSPDQSRWMARCVQVEQDAIEGKVISLIGRTLEDGRTRECGAFIWWGSGRAAVGGGKTEQDAIRWEYRASFQAGTGFAGVALTWPTPDKDWPIHGEIDIIELFDGRRTGVGQTFIHKDRKVGSRAADCWPKSGHYSTIDWTAWNDIACEWVPTKYVAVFHKLPHQKAWKELCREKDARWIPDTLPHRLTFQMETGELARPYAKEVRWRIARMAAYRPKATAR